MERPKVLVVEDNRLLRWWMLSSLDREGFLVLAPESVTEALRLATLSPFDVLITDWRLADGHNGFEVLAELRQKFPRILSILISAEADADLAERARSVGFNFVIQKPFPVAEIVGAVHSLADGHRFEVA